MRVNQQILSYAALHNLNNWISRNDPVMIPFISGGLPLHTEIATS
jgi:hypothetical protein